MRIYYLDVDNLEINFDDYEYIFNLQQFYIEMNELHQDGWYECLVDVEVVLEDLKKGSEK